MTILVETKPKQGSFLGSILLICGSSIGVGILPLPVLTGQAGTLVTLAVFSGCGLFMSITALLLLETSLLFSGEKNFVSMAKVTLNRTGQVAVFCSFIFLFYSLTTAYLAKGGELVNHVLHSRVECMGSILLAILSGVLVFFGPLVVDHINRLFMVGFFLTYFFLSFVGIDYFHVENITHSDWSLSVFVIPFLITSFGYHNMIPSINQYMGNHKPRLVPVVMLSGAVLFLIYSFWIVMLHGIVPLGDLKNSFINGEIATEPLARLIQVPFIQVSTLYLAFFAIITSLLGQGLSIIDFLADSLQIKKTARVKIGLCLLLFVPTCLCSQLIPGVFFKALELVGGVAAMVIFGIIPALMSWTVRYRNSARNLQVLVPGGKITLVVIIVCACSLICYELVRHVG